MFRAALQVVISDFFHLRLGVKISNIYLQPQGVYSVCSSRPAFPTGPSVHFIIIIIIIIIIFFFKRSTAYQVEKVREMITSFYSQVLQFEQAE